MRERAAAGQERRAREMGCQFPANTEQDPRHCRSECGCVTNAIWYWVEIRDANSEAIQTLEI